MHPGAAWLPRARLSVG
ncbi:hypothetical protein E2C01_073259 [Portunus trituberculatus]|uniref:Uncharacterized protein n=1 Tax=Portunus trituberculatus TaxID=210409 RepID=A0A5B7I4R1_PORTR|nr:hypothetical protein [Portunus trituberculatus]